MVQIQLDKSRRLKFGVTAAREYKRVFGERLVSAWSALAAEALSGKLEGLLDLDAVCNLLWAALRHEDQSLTPDRVALLLDKYLDGTGTLPELHKLLAEAFHEGMRSLGFEKVAEGEGGKAPSAASEPSS